jgi:hypothetical protein
MKYVPKISQLVGNWLGSEPLLSASSWQLPYHREMFPGKSPSYKSCKESITYITAASFCLVMLKWNKSDLS